MLVHDYECKSCGNISEHYIVNYDNIPDIIPCPVCNNVAHKIFSKAKTPITDAAWIRDVLEVVQKDSDKRHCQEFLHNPTRDNYKIWMKKEGVRHIEAGEKPGRPKPAPSQNVITEKLMKQRMRKRRIEIR